MSSYTARVTLTAPVALADLCAAIARGMDEDWGGASAFRTIHASYDADGLPIGEPLRLEAAFWATPDFAAGCQALMAMPDALHATLARDYAARWPDLTPPTLAEVQAWCEAVTLEVIQHE